MGFINLNIFKIEDVFDYENLKNSLKEKFFDGKHEVLIKEKNETTKHQTSSRDQMGLIIPKLPKEYNSVEMLESTLTYKRVTKDNNGYIITMELTTKAEFATIEVKEVLIDGFYVTTKFAISDTIDRDADGYELPEQIPTEYKFRIKQTELDELGIFGFNEIKIFYDIYLTISSK